MTPTGNRAAALEQSDRKRDLLDLFGVSAGASYDLRVAADAFDKAALCGDQRDVPRALATLRAAARRCIQAADEYERSLIQFPKTAEG